MEGIGNAVQIAIFNALDGSTDLTSLLASHVTQSRSAVYGSMPNVGDTGSDDLFPFVTIGEDQVSDWSTDTASGGEVSVVINIWSRADGWREAKQISKAVYDALHRQELTTPDHEFIACEFESDQPIRDSDGETLHIASEYRMWVDEVGYGN